MRRRHAGAVLAVAALVAPSAYAQQIEAPEGRPIPIASEAIEATVEDGVAVVEVDQTFQNESDTTLEGLYRVDLPVGAVIKAFSLWLGGKECGAQVVTTWAAGKDFRSAANRLSDRMPSLRRSRPDLVREPADRLELRLVVGPIPARGTARVKLAYAHVVRDDAGAQMVEIALPEAGARVRDLSVHVSLAESRGLATVTCPDVVDAKVDCAGRSAEVKWSATDLAPKAPFLVCATPARATGDGVDVSLQVNRTPGASEGAFLARIVARRAELPTIRRDLVFVVDRSDSMAGEKLEQARSALLAGCDLLRPGDRFDVVAFANDCESLGGGALLDADPTTLERARQFIRGLTASCATHLRRALAASVRELSPRPERLQALVLLSDGGDCPERVENGASGLLERPAPDHVRLFALGLGDDVDGSLLAQLVAAQAGEVRCARRGENAAPIFRTLLDPVQRPLLLAPTFDCGGRGVRVTATEPQTPCDLTADRAWYVSGRFTGSGPATFHLQGRAGGSPMTIDVPVEFSHEAPRRQHVSQLWADARVQRLDRQLDHDARNEKLRDEILDLGLTHRLVTKFTSLRLDAPARAAVATWESHGGIMAFASRHQGPDARLGQACYRSFDWFAQHQTKDGSFALEGRPIEATGLALLSFLGMGETPAEGAFREVTRSATRRLLAAQDEQGGFAPPSAPDFMRQHAVAATAVVEAFGMTGAPALAAPAKRAFEFALSHRKQGAAWTLPDGGIDVETTGWMAILIWGACKSEIADERPLLEELVRALDAVTDRASGRIVSHPGVAASTALHAANDATAIGVFVRLLARHDIASDLLLARGLNTLRAESLERDAAAGRVDFARWHFASLALFQAGAENWKDWDGQIRRAANSLSSKGGATDHLIAWSETAVDRDDLGIVGATAFNALLMETNWRYPRISSEKR